MIDSKVLELIDKVKAWMVFCLEVSYWCGWWDFGSNLLVSPNPNPARFEIALPDLTIGVRAYSLALMFALIEQFADGSIGMRARQLVVNT